MLLKHVASRDMLLYFQYWHENVFLNEVLYSIDGYFKILTQTDDPRSSSFMMIAVVVYIVLREESD